MNVLSNDRFVRIGNWVRRNARPLDAARWKFHFGDGGGEDVLGFLAAYANADGGFGNALEADSWNPDSSPYTSMIATRLLKEIGITDGKHPVVRGILRYLDETPVFTGKYWPAVIKSNDAFPHAPWWTYGPDFVKEWGYTPTAELAAFILRFAEPGSNLFGKARIIAHDAVETYLNGVLPDGKPYRDIPREGEIEGFHSLLLCLEEKGLEASLLPDLERALKEQVGKAIERDISRWTAYSRKPSFYIHSPDSIFLDGNGEIMDAELDFILDTVNDEGVWDIPWTWGAYEKEFAVSRILWKGTKAVEYVLLLKNFGRLRQAGSGDAVTGALR